MGAAVLVLFGLPGTTAARSAASLQPRWNIWLYGLFVVNFAVLGLPGHQAAVSHRHVRLASRHLVLLRLLLLMPWWSRIGEFKPVPARVTFEPH
jgi:ubiquinol-cytochrome c reductase cytochrome b subunit